MSTTLTISEWVRQGGHSAADLIEVAAKADDTMDRLERELAEARAECARLREALRFLGACAEGIRKCAEYMRDGTTAAPNVSAVFDDIAKQGGLMRDRAKKHD